jgi:integrase
MPAGTAVDQYIKAMQTQGVADATINRRLQILSATLKLAVERKHLVTAPRIRKLSEAGNARQGFFEQAEVDAVVSALPPHLRDVVRFAHATGWRRSEITSLRFDMIKDGVLVLPDSKNGRPRRLPIAGEIAEILARRETARTYTRPDGEPRVADLIFHRSGRGVGDFKRAWGTALEKAGLTHQEKDPVTGIVTVAHDRVFHDLRRSAARRLLRAGVQQITAMRLLGHRSPSVFTRYAITSDADLREALQQVESTSTS